MASGNDKEVKIGITAETAGADEAKRALEGVKQAAEEAGKGTAGAAIVPGADTAGAVEAVTVAISKQTESSRELAGVNDELRDDEPVMIDLLRKRSEVNNELLEDEPILIDLLTKRAEGTRQLSEESRRLIEESKKSGGSKSVFDPERMKAAAGELKELGKAVGSFALEFAKTEQGQELMAGLSEETKVFGEVALSVASSVAEGFATGGPIGGALAGLTAAVKTVADEYLDAQRRIEEANRKLEEAEAKAAEKRKAKQRAAVSDQIERMLEGENDLLERQNTSLQSGAKLWSARKESAQANLDLERAKAEFNGEDTTAIDRKQIDLDYKSKMFDIQGERNRANTELTQAIRARDVAAEAAKREGESSSLGSPAYAQRLKESQDAQKEVERLEEDLPRRMKEFEIREKTAGTKRDTSLYRLEDDRKDREMEERRKQQEGAHKRGEEEAKRSEKREREAAGQKQREIDAGFEAEKMVAQAVPIAGRRMGGDAVQALGELREKFKDGASTGELDELLRDLLVLAKKGGTGGVDGKTIEKLQLEVRQLKAKLTTQGDVIN